MDPATVPVYETEAAALEAELSGASGAASTNGRADAPRVVVPVLPRRARGRVRAARRASARRQVDAADGLRDLSPRLADQRRR